MAHAGHVVAFLTLQKKVLLIPRAQIPVIFTVTGLLLILAIAGRREHVENKFAYHVLAAALQGGADALEHGACELTEVNVP